MIDIMQENVIFKEKEIISHYFPHLEATQYAQFQQLGDLYTYWNARINLISRKDIEHLYARHILHSLAIAKIMPFQAEAHILDLGTGGGFPGIPLAILFPHTHFHLVDAIQKKINVVSHISDALSLDNVTPLCLRAEKITTKYDFILSRAVSRVDNLYQWTKGKIKKKSTHPLTNGLLCWKGGDLTQELKSVPMKHTIFPLTKIFKDDFFQEKQIVHLFL